MILNVDFALKLRINRSFKLFICFLFGYKGIKAVKKSTNRRSFFCEKSILRINHTRTQFYLNPCKLWTEGEGKIYSTLMVKNSIDKRDGMTLFPPRSSSVAFTKQE